MPQYVRASYKTPSFNCPFCGVFSAQIWSTLLNITHATFSGHASYNTKDITLAQCQHCREHSIWKNEKMVFPIDGNTDLPNSDLPDDVFELYQEARKIVNLSPKGAAALLRLAIQKLCVHLGEEGKDINTDIGNLVKKGLPASIIRAFDSIRFVGNKAVHPGTIDFSDGTEVAYPLFTFVNLICDMLITQPKKIDNYFETYVPETVQAQIQRRDSIV